VRPEYSLDGDHGNIGSGCSGRIDKAFCKISSFSCIGDRREGVGRILWTRS
jgi:hypothetical protein